MGSMWDVADRPRLNSAGVDYLTLSLKPEARGWMQLEHVLWANMTAEQANGDKLEAAKRNGYTGWRTSDMFMGTGDQGHLYSVSGGRANNMMEVIKNYDTRAKCTRIDVRADGVSANDNGGLNTAAYRSYHEKRAIESLVRPRHCALFCGRNGGWTVQFGSPASERRCRFYDKSRESGNLASPWTLRAEVQYRGDQAQTVFWHLREVKDFESGCTELVRGGFDSVGCDIVYLSDVTPLRVSSLNEKSTDDRRLAWLAAQVKPTVAGLCARGRRAEVIQALGLSDDSG